MNRRAHPQHPVIAYVEELLQDDSPRVEQAPPAEVAPQVVVPPWGHGVFPCLVWEAGGLRLAVALAQLQSVLPAPNQLRVAPDDPTWLMGHSGGARALRVIDLAAWIWAAQGSPTPTRCGAERLLLTGAEGWALACPPGGDTAQLRSSEVTWRTAQTRRRWLAGTLHSPRCALIDVDALIAAVAASIA